MIEPLAVVAVGQYRQASVLFHPRNAASRRLAHDESPLPIEQQTVRACIFAIDARLAVLVTPPDLPAAAREQAQLRMPRRPLARALFLQYFGLRTRRDNGLIGKGEGRPQDGANENSESR